MNTNNGKEEGEFSPAGWHLLIVEDSATQALKLRILLAEAGYAVSVCENGAKALAFLQQQSSPPDMVVSDIVMPAMDGYALCRQIRDDERFKRIPVLLLSTLSKPEDILKGLSCGAYNFLTKPYEPEDLLDRIQYLLVNSKLRGTPDEPVTVEVFFNGETHALTSDRFQILDLLFSTYDNVLKQNRELEKVNSELRQALATIDVLQDLLPICCNCKKIRDQEDNWQNFERYISSHSRTKFSHGICPECMRELYPELFEEKGKKD